MRRAGQPRAPLVFVRKDRAMHATRPFVPALALVVLAGCAQPGARARARPAAAGVEAGRRRHAACTRAATTRCGSIPRTRPTASRSRSWTTCTRTWSSFADTTTEIVPELATRWEISPRRPDLHVPPAPGREVPRRHAVQRGGRRVLARAPARQEAAACGPRRRRAVPVLAVGVDGRHPARHRGG